MRADDLLPDYSTDNEEIWECSKEEKQSQDTHEQETPVYSNRIYPFLTKLSYFFCSNKTSVDDEKKRYIEARWNGRGQEEQNQVFFCRFFRELVIAELNHQVAELSLSEAGLA